MEESVLVPLLIVLVIFGICFLIVLGSIIIRCIKNSSSSTNKTVSVRNRRHHLGHVNSHDSFYHNNAFESNLPLSYGSSEGLYVGGGGSVSGENGEGGHSGGGSHSEGGGGHGGGGGDSGRGCDSGVGDSGGGCDSGGGFDSGGGGCDSGGGGGYD